MAKSAPVTIPTEPIGSIPRPVDLIERIAKGDGEDPSLDPFMRMRFETPLNSLKPQALRWLPTANSGSIIISVHTVCMAFEHGAGRLHYPVQGRSYAPPLAPHVWPLPLQAVCRRLFGCRHALRARAGQAGGDIAFGPESDVPSRKPSKLFTRAIHHRSAE